MIDGKLTDDYSIQTVLFKSDFPECIEQTKPSTGKVQVDQPSFADGFYITLNTDPRYCQIRSPLADSKI